MAAKKWLVGCLVVLLVFIGGAVAAWVFIVKPMWRAGVEEATAWASAVDLGDDITNQAPFDPPADGRMTPAQVDAFVRVQRVVADEMGPDLARLLGMSQAAMRQRAADGQGPSLSDLGAAYGEATGLMARWRAAQARGINATGLSREEYAWVRRQSLVAMSQLVDPAALAGMVELPPGVPRITTPDPADEAALAAARHNAALLRPHVPLLQQTLGGIPASR